MSVTTSQSLRRVDIFARPFLLHEAKHYHRFNRGLRVSSLQVEELSRANDSPSKTIIELSRSTQGLNISYHLGTEPGHRNLENRLSSADTHFLINRSRWNLALSTPFICTSCFPCRCFAMTCPATAPAYPSYRDQRVGK